MHLFTLYLDFNCPKGSACLAYLPTAVLNAGCYQAQLHYHYYYYFLFLFFFIIFSDFLCFPNNTDNLRAYIILLKKYIITLNFLLTRVISSIIARISNLQ